MKGGKKSLGELGWELVAKMKKGIETEIRESTEHILGKQIIEAPSKSRKTSVSGKKRLAQGMIWWHERLNAFNFI